MKKRTSIQLFANQCWLAFLSALITLFTVAQPPVYASQTDDIYNLFQLDFPSTDIVILLDTSQSMIRHQYGHIRQSIIDFAPTLTDRDNIHLRIFGDTAGNPLEGNGNKVAAALDQYLPQEPAFSHTDLGLAILKAIEFLERDGASKIQAFFLLTDGLHQPPQDSPFSRDVAGDPEWEALKQRAHELCDQHAVFVYGFGLGHQTDISILRQVFPAKNVEVIAGGVAQVVQALHRVRERLSRTQLRQAIEREIDKGVVEVRLPNTSITAEARTFDLPITIHNGYRRLPVRIENIYLERELYSSKEISCELQGDWANRLLEPGQQWHGKIKGVLDAQAPSLRVGKAHQLFQATFKLVPILRFHNEASLEELGIGSIQPLTARPSLTVDLRASYGISYWSLAGLILALAMASSIAIKRLKRTRQRNYEIRRRQAERRRLAGTLRIWPSGQGEPEDRASDLGDYRSEQLNLVIVNGSGLEITAEDGPPDALVARLSGSLIDASPYDGESGKPEFYIEAASGHTLSYESCGNMIPASRAALCAGDLLEIDGKWRLRYVNHRLRTRAEVESSLTVGEYHV